MAGESDPSSSPAASRRKSVWQRIGRWGDRLLLRSVPEYQWFPSEEAPVRAIAELDQELEKSRWFGRTVLWIAVLGTIAANASLCVVPMLSPWRMRGQTAIAMGLIVVAAIAAVIWRGGGELFGDCATS